MSSLFCRAWLKCCVESGVVPSCHTCISEQREVFQVSSPLLKITWLSLSYSYIQNTVVITY